MRRNDIALAVSDFHRTWREKRRKYPCQVCTEHIPRLTLLSDQVFDYSNSSTSDLLAQTLTKYRIPIAFDMGAGSGAQSIVMIHHKIADLVVAYERNPAAYENCRHNVRYYRYATTRQVQVELADLGQILSGQQLLKVPMFDGGVFNQPYFPSRETQSRWNAGGEGGEPLIKRFFAEFMPTWVHPGGPVLMPFTEHVGDEHNPGKIAAAMGLSVKLVAEKTNERGHHFIFDIRVPLNFKRR